MPELLHPTARSRPRPGPSRPPQGPASARRASPAERVAAVPRGDGGRRARARRRLVHAPEPGTVRRDHLARGLVTLALAASLALPTRGCGPGARGARARSRAVALDGDRGVVADSAHVAIDRLARRGLSPAFLLGVAGLALLALAALLVCGARAGSDERPLGATPRRRSRRSPSSVAYLRRASGRDRDPRHPPRPRSRGRRSTSAGPTSR